MEKSFSWKHFDRMSKALESIGYVVMVFGPILGIALVVFGSTMFRLVGLAIVVASFLIAMYHISFSLLMNGIHDLKKHLETSPYEYIEDEKPKITES